MSLRKTLTEASRKWKFGKYYCYFDKCNISIHNYNLSNNLIRICWTIFSMLKKKQRLFTIKITFLHNMRYLF